MDDIAEVLEYAQEVHGLDLSKGAVFMKTYTTVQGDMWEQRDAAPNSREKRSLTQSQCPRSEVTEHKSAVEGMPPWKKVNP